MRLMHSLRGELLLWLGVPLLLLWALSVYTHYQSALQAANQAYDRSLLASARTVAERLVVRQRHLEVDVPWVVLDSFERNMNDQLFYQVISPQGNTLSGYPDLPLLPRNAPLSEAYPALVHFYDAHYRRQPIRVAALWQPVNEEGVEGMALVLVAETLNSRHAFADSLLRTALISQSFLVLITLLLAGMLLRRVLRPLRRLSRIMLRRAPGELTPLPSLVPWSELQPLIVAFNRHLERLRGLLARQERFSADVSHQLRTPLTILKTQVSVALSSDDPQQWRESLQGMRHTLNDTVELTDRLLQLAQIKARHGEDKPFTRVDLSQIVQQACLSGYTAARHKQIDLGFEGEEACRVQGDALLLAELCANLLDNAIKYTPAQGTVTARLQGHQLEIEDSGPGIDAAQQQQALQPFARLDPSGQPGAGIGLALVKDICAWHGARLRLDRSPQLGGLRVTVSFP
ncbi:MULTISPECIES: sensor histidine kinase [Pantoea]|uniref:sensor histidine kinase n=1 Tax=Pantoea TaxID=53335 RepID=UPI000A2595FE|nr:MULTISPECIES: sensor histidine kinase [Pantoea]KAA6050651.1 HAMP domain-containing protein [Pantoea sp. Bo_7]KAA6095004.1 HAMP domain-containing protein [Pantoea sp. Bo_10]ORM79199.1 histidine kinase [Pantoea eucrina]RBO13262.1 sensor histidine kinase [Pantoea sp. 3_1284]